VLFQDSFYTHELLRSWLFLLALTKNGRFLNNWLGILIWNLVLQLSHVLLIFSVLLLRPSNFFVVNSATHSLYSRIIGFLTTNVELFVFKHFGWLAELPVLVALVSFILLFETTFWAFEISFRSPCFLVKDVRSVWFISVYFAKTSLLHTFICFMFTALKCLIPLRLNHAQSARCHFPSTHGIVVHLLTELTPPSSALINTASRE
jgi:hypothetical protein